MSTPVEMTAASVPESVARIRRFTVEACRAAEGEVDCDAVALLVSEVATNALVHGAGEVRVRVLPSSSAVRVEVSDDSSVIPALRRASAYDEGGRGLALVDALATAWGTQPTPQGKTVWFDVG